MINEIYDIDKIIVIQKYIKRYIIKNKILIPPSYYQTKDWRMDRKWYKNGKSNECEKYQINTINKLLSCELKKTNERINLENYEIINKKNIIKNDNGYEFSENFDGLIFINNNNYYFNLKLICDQGGSQTRSLREVYHFIKAQMEYLLIYNNETYFINILDGDTSYHNMNKFNYLLNKEKYREVIKFIFIGSLYDFQNNKYRYF